MRTGLIASLLAASLAVVSLAHADEPLAPMPLHAPVVSVDEPYWYGIGNLGADTAALALGIAGGEDNRALHYGAVGVYALGGPTVHLLEGHPARAAVSLVVRMSLPLILGAGDDFGGATALGLLGAVVIDDFFLAQDVRKVEHRGWGPTVAPVANGGVSFGAAGVF